MSGNLGRKLFPYCLGEKNFPTKLCLVLGEEGEHRMDWESHGSFQVDNGLKNRISYTWRQCSQSRCLLIPFDFLFVYTFGVPVC